MTKRNGKIELLRFAFCMMILLYHLNRDLWNFNLDIADGLSFFGNGRHGVEFFFLVTGFLTAKNAFKRRQVIAPVGKSTMQFIFKKMATIFPAHIIVVLVTGIYLIVRWGQDGVIKVIKRIPSIFFLQFTGINDDRFVNVEWYICAMLFALAVLYPLLRWNYDVTARIVAPFTSVILMGFLIHTYGQLPGGKEFVGVTFASNLRAFAVISLGIFCFEVSRCLQGFKLTKTAWRILYIVENACYILVFYFICSDIDKHFEGCFVLLQAVAITITFSRNFSGFKIYDNKLVYYLGEISLPIYLCQNVMRNITQDICGGMDKKLQLIIMTVSVVAVGVAIHYLAQGLVRFTRKIKTKYLISNNE